MSQDKILIKKQILAARGLLEMTQAELAEAAGISVQALNAIEQGKSVPRLSTSERIREACERRGIEFTNSDNPGVRLIRANAIIPPK